LYEGKEQEKEEKIGGETKTTQKMKTTRKSTGRIGATTV
jgi:hypothetical protein